MKLVKSSTWYRLRGQLGPNNEVAKIDTLVTERSRVFFVPETEEEKTFFGIDMALNLTQVPHGPCSDDANGEWGWRWYDSKTEEDCQKFAESIKNTMANVYENGLGKQQGDNKIMN